MSTPSQPKRRQGLQIDVMAALAPRAANDDAPIVTRATYSAGKLQVDWTATAIPFLTGFAVTAYDTTGTWLHNWPAGPTARSISEAVAMDTTMAYKVMVTAMLVNLPGPSSQPFPVTFL